MNLEKQIKPISFLKASTADAVRAVTESGEPLFITQNGEAKIVVQDIRSYEQAQETMALLKILALGEKEIEQGSLMSANEAREAAKRRLNK